MGKFKLPHFCFKKNIMLKDLFKLRGELDSKTDMAISISGMFFFLTIWHIITTSGIINESLLPKPMDVLTSFKELHFDDFLIRNLFYSIKLNYLGYLEAIIVALPIGFIIGLFPFFRSLLSRYVDAARFIPLTAVVGIFIAWFGIEDAMKVRFLAFGIFVYLLPIVVQRVSEVNKVFVQTARTLGATKWQIIRKVFIPAVLSKLSDDIRVIVAISWTYIIIAEMVNKTGGVGAMIFTAARQSRTDKVFALLVVIVLIGILQDLLFKWLDRVIFPHKYINK